ncbi:translational activator [Xylona heveae TC161]|uniref:eIF-2-alpha kinase activator GCN1 n=1 Tax=Xylona heveae (strain CBS 132557 / TC161) TaxID=1328760 RepID=A0A165FVX9_XYLHT|nr:translational activator [Xylona heveae TC161]KZF21445.1 translational activator [Xylona heveae TC161]
MEGNDSGGAPNWESNSLPLRLLSSSTNARKAELHTLQERISHQDIPQKSFSLILASLFETYPLYIDRASRQAVQQCLLAIVNSGIKSGLDLSPLIKLIKDEAAKSTIAPTHAFVLVEWCSLLLQRFSTESSLWEKWGLDLLLADSQLLELCQTPRTRNSVKHSALVVTRRALRKVFTTGALGESAIKDSVGRLTAKAPAPVLKNAIFLGVIAGVCARIEKLKPVLYELRKDFYSFYAREFLGSRGLVPEHIADGLHDFFAAFATKQDLKENLIPSIEKALLRAPEVVLNGLITPLIRSLPADVDLSDILEGNLLKALLSNVKSSNPNIRAGVLSAFELLVSRCHEEKCLVAVTNEILGPLKSSKLPSAEHRVLHAQMISTIPTCQALAETVPATLAPVATKEPNEAAISAEAAAISKHFRYALSEQLKVERSVTDVFIKGIGDKRGSVRRGWTLRVGEIIWSLREHDFGNTETISFLQATLPKMLDIFKEVVANPLSAAQNGLITIAYVVTALYASKLRLIKDGALSDLFEKASIVKQSLALEPKPSFLLYHRIYTKLASEEDTIWAIRSLAALYDDLPSTKRENSTLQSWALAFIYFVCAASIPPAIRREATHALTLVYVKRPEVVGPAIISGLWLWNRQVSLDDKDSPATSAKTGISQLLLVIRSICPSKQEVEKLSGKVEKNILEDQLLALQVLCRPELIPSASWIEVCLRTGMDPGTLVNERPLEYLDAIERVYQDHFDSYGGTINHAGYKASAELAFVAPDVITPLLKDRVASYVDPQLLQDIGPTEAAIFRTPEGTTFIDPLAKKGQSIVPDKNVKDYDIMKWEEELRTQLAQKAGAQKKLTAEERAKVNAQLDKEAEIRKSVAHAQATLRRGAGLVEALATGPPTDAEAWMGEAVKDLLGVIEAGAGLILGDTAANAYVACASLVSSRLGVLRPFFGIATLRALGSSTSKPELEQEPLGDLITRLLYRLRFAGEQRPFDTISLIYLLPLIFVVIKHGGVGRTNAEDGDEQVVLALEFISFHTDAFSRQSLQRNELLSSLIFAMQKYTQHYRLVKDCLTDSCRFLAPNIAEPELQIVLRGVILPEIPVRTALLQAIHSELDLTDFEFSEEIWLAYHDDVSENRELAQAIWAENGLEVDQRSGIKMIPYLRNVDKQLRRAASRALAHAVELNPSSCAEILARLEDEYREAAKPRVPELDRYGMPKRMDLSDPWEARHGIALAFKELATSFDTAQLVSFVQFLIENGPLGDRSSIVRQAMIDAAIAIIGAHGHTKLEELMKIFETTLAAPDKGSEMDTVNEAVIILYGALAGHLKRGDERIPKVTHRLLATLSTPSETVQYAVAECLPPLIRASTSDIPNYIQQMLDDLFHSKKYATRRGAAYGLAGIVRGRGISALREFRIMATLKSATENKKDPNYRQGALFAYELLSLVLGRMFEPYTIQIVPNLLSGFGDSTADVREACLDAAKTCFASLSSYGVKQILPTLLDGLDDQQWRSKKGACDLLGAMAYLDPQQLAQSLPDIIPPLTDVLNDSHKEVRASANRSLQRFGEVITSPEIKGVVNILLKALSDPTKFTDDALDALIKVSFVHYIDAPSLALVVRILERGLGDRSATKRKSSQIIGSLAHLTERKDLVAHLPILVAGLKIAVIDPVPTTRATASKAFGSLMEKLGEDALPDLIPDLMTTLKSDTGAGDRLGSAQALSEVLAGLGTSRLEETLPTILQNVSSSKPAVREGFMSLFIFLPACFGNSFSAYLNRIIPPILAGLADEVDSIRETSLRAGRLLVKNFATRSIDLLLPELERGLADDSYRIRLSSVELVGDLLFSLTGITATGEQEEDEEKALEAGHSLLEVLGEEKRNKVLSSLYICRCDTSGLVRTAAVNVWKALVASPRILKELIPTLTQLIIRRLASSNMEHKVIAGNALGELIRKAGEGVLATLLPYLEEGLQTSTDADARQGICIALRELIASASPEAIEDYEKTLISIVRTALVDTDEDVREAAAEAFDSLQKIIGKKAVDQVLPHLLSLLRTEGEADNALSALLTLLTENTRANIILPILIPTLLTSPISAFNAKAVASLSQVASGALTRRLPNIINSLLDNIVDCQNEELRTELDGSFDTVLLSVDEYEGLNTTMSVMLGLVKHDDHRKRASADLHLAKFFTETQVDYSRYYPDLIRVLLLSFDDHDMEVVKAAWTALSALTKKLRKEEMESLVFSSRQTLQQVGVPGANLTGFSLPKGINAILPIFLQGLMNGTTEQRVQSALAISDLVARTSEDSLKPFVTQITGPLIRVVSERSVDVKSAILFTLNNLLEKIPTFLKPFLPQLQRTFAKSLADASSEDLRNRAAKALGTLITLTPRIDPLIAELVAGSKTPDPGVKNAMLKALYEVVSKAGANMSEASRNAIFGLIDTEIDESDDAMAITNARLLGAIIKNLPEELAGSLIKNRILLVHHNKASVLGLNSILAESPLTLAPFTEEVVGFICQGISNGNAYITEGCILAAGKYLLSESGDKSFETTKSIFEVLAPIIKPGSPADARRLALVVLRTVSRMDNELVRPHLALLAPPTFASVRDMVIPVKLSAEAAFLALFSVVDDESAVFDKYMAGAGAELPPNVKRSMGDYFKRVAIRLGNQARERKEAEGGHGGLGLSADELEDEREIWSVGRVDLGGDLGFGDA